MTYLTNNNKEKGQTTTKQGERERDGETSTSFRQSETEKKNFKQNVK